MTSQPPASPAAMRLLAGTVADAIRERLIAHRPVDSASKAVILAYTIRMRDALGEACLAHGIDLDVTDISAALAAAHAEAASRGYAIPDIP